MLKKFVYKKPYQNYRHREITNIDEATIRKMISKWFLTISWSFTRIEKRFIHRSDPSIHRFYSFSSTRGTWGEHDDKYASLFRTIAIKYGWEHFSEFSASCSTRVEFRPQLSRRLMERWMKETWSASATPSMIPRFKHTRGKSATKYILIRSSHRGSAAVPRLVHPSTSLRTCF